jgi:hypothetical protein
MQRKALWISVITVLFLLLTGTGVWGQSPVVRAEIDADTYKVGEVITLRVNLDSNPGLHSLYCDLAYDGTVMEFVSLSQGTMVNEEYQPNEFLYAVSDSVTSNIRGNHLILSYTLQGAGVLTYRTGLLCEIRFRVKTPGEAGMKYQFTFNSAAVTDGIGNNFTGVSWSSSPYFTIGSSAYRSFVLITKPYDMEVIYEDRVEVKAISSTGLDYYVRYENKTTGEVTLPIPANTSNLPAQTFHLNKGYNNIAVTLYQRINGHDYMIAIDQVRVYHPEDDKYIKILSPKPNQVVNTDLVEVIISSPYEEVTVNGLAAQFYEEGNGENKLYRTRLWLRKGFNTITAEAVGPEKVKYKDTIRVYYQKDSSIFSFISPRVGEYYKSAADAYLHIEGEIDSEYRTSANAGEGPVPNTVTLQVLYRPNNPQKATIMLVDNKLAKIKETDDNFRQAHSGYLFYNDFEISLAGLGSGEIEIIAYKNKEGNCWDDKIHRLVYVDDQRLWIDLVQPNVYSCDLLDNRWQLRNFNEAKEPHMENSIVSTDGGIVLAPGEPVIAQELLVSTADLAEDKDGTLYALTNNQVTGSLSIYRKRKVDAGWNLVLTRSQMHGYALCATDKGILVGVSNLYASEDSGLYLLQDDRLVNIQFPVTLQHVQFIQNRNGIIYIYGNYYNYLYSFNIHTLTQGSNGLLVDALNRVDFANNFNLKQFVLSTDCETAILRRENGRIHFYNRTAAGYLPVKISEAKDDIELTGRNIIAGEYKNGDYNAYLILKDDTHVISIMEYTKGQRRYFTSEKIAVDKLLKEKEVRLYAAGFKNNAFYFLYQGAGSGLKLKEGQVFFEQFYSQEDPVVYPCALVPNLLSAQLFITSKNQLYLGAGSGLPDHLAANTLYHLYHQLPNLPGKISFNYVNDDIEGICGFSFELDPAWLELEGAVEFGFAVKEKSSGNNRLTTPTDAVLFQAEQQCLADLIRVTENEFYTLYRHYDPITEREVIHFVFKNIQEKRYLSFDFQLFPIGNASPGIYNFKIDKKTHLQIASPSSEEITIPIHGFIYDRTVTEVMINQARIPLGRDGSFRYDYVIKQSGNLVPVLISCINSSGEIADLRFVVEIVESQNGLANIQYMNQEEYKDFTEGILASSEESLTLAGKYYGMVGSVVGYELYGYEYKEGIESVVLVKRGLFQTIQDQTVFREFALNRDNLGSGYTAGYFQDEEITLIPGRQQLRLYIENPGGLRYVYKINGEYPDVDYVMPETEQKIIFSLEPNPDPVVVQEVPIEYHLRLKAYEEEELLPDQKKAYVFRRSYELFGEIKSLYNFSDLLVKSFTPGLVFENGETEQVVQVGAGNRFRIKVMIQMNPQEQEEDFDLGVIPTIPALINLRTGVRLKVSKAYEDTYFIPDFSRMQPENWTEEEHGSRCIPFCFRFNRDDLPVPGSLMTLTVNHTNVITGTLKRKNETDYWLKDEDGRNMELTDKELKQGRNRISWVLHYGSEIMSSSNSGRSGMTDFIFDYTEVIESTPTEVRFNPALTSQYYEEETLPKLMINKDAKTKIEIQLNEKPLMEGFDQDWTAMEINLVNPALREGRNELVITYTELQQDPITKIFSFLYDSKNPEAAIASWVMDDEERFLSEITAIVKEANFTKANLYYGQDIISQHPEVIIIAADQYLLRWTNLFVYEIAPSKDRPVMVKAYDHSGKAGLSTELILSGNKRPGEETAREIAIDLPLYTGLPLLAHERNHHSRPSAAHTKFAPRRFLPKESVISKIGKDGDYLARNLFEQKVTVGDGSGGEESVAICGNYAIVGLPNENDGKGAAYIFKLDENGVWGIIQRLEATDSTANARFGWSVSISENLAIIGTPNENSEKGAAYLFEREVNGNWIRKEKWQGTVTEGRFGWSVAVSGDTAVVGAPTKRYKPDFRNEKGSVYIYKQGSNGIWNTSKILSSSSVYPFPIHVYGKVIGELIKIRYGGDLFGYSVSLSGNKLVVGNPKSFVQWGYFLTANEYPGEVILYEFDNSGIWNETYKYKDNNVNNMFGSSVAISGNRAIVGSKGLNNNKGAAYIFEPNSSGKWGKTQNLVARDGTKGDKFGCSVSIAGNKAIVGVDGDHNSIGTAYIFDLQGNSYQIVTSNKIKSDGFGSEVAISESTALVGARSNFAYFYKQDKPQWYPLIPGDQKYLVFKIAKDILQQVGSKEDIIDCIRFEVLGQRLRNIDGKIEEVNPSQELILDNEKNWYLDGFNHLYYLVEVSELRTKFLEVAEHIFPGGYVEEGYSIYDLGSLRVRYETLVTADNLVDIYTIGDLNEELRNILLYDPNYADLEAPTYLDPVLTYQPAEVSQIRPNFAEEMTLNFWLRLDDEGLLEPEYINTVKKRVITFFSAENRPLIEIGYRGNILYLYDLVEQSLIPLGYLTTFMESKKWNMITVRMTKERSELQIGFNNQWIDYGEIAPSTIAAILAEGAKLYFGPLEREDYNTGFFSVASPFYIDQYLTNDEMYRIYELSDQYMSTEREYHFPDMITDYGNQQQQLRIVGNGSDYFTPFENYNPKGINGDGSLKASSRLRNLLSVPQGTDKNYVTFTEANDCILYNMEVQGEADCFTLHPKEGRTGRYFFGDINSNYGLGKDRWYSVTGRVIALESQTTARLVLRINGREESWQLQPGRFHFIYENLKNETPAQVQLYIETDGMISLAKDVTLNQGNYIITKDLARSAVKTSFPFGLSGTVHFWYKPLNANPDGFINYSAVLFDSELIKIWTDVNQGEDALFYAGIKDADGQIQETIKTNVKVGYDWQHLQVSYSFKDTTNDCNVISFYINGSLAGALEGIRFSPFGSLVGEVPETDNVWLGCDCNEGNFAQGYLDAVVLSKHYLYEQYQPQPIGILDYDEAVAEIQMKMAENIGEQDALRYCLVAMDSHFKEEGDCFPIDLSGKTAGRYRLTVDLVIRGHNYQQIFFFNIDSRPRFVLKEHTPIIFQHVAKDLHFKLGYDLSYRLEDEALQFIGVAARISGGTGEQTRYLVQDFINQQPSQWLLGIEEAEEVHWASITPDNSGLLDLVFPEVEADSSVQCNFKYFYFQTSFSEKHRYDQLPAVDLTTRVPMAALTQPLYPEKDHEGYEYKLVVDITNGEGGVLDPIFADIQIDYETVDLKTSVSKRGSINLNSTGKGELFYDDILHWKDNVPLYGEYYVVLKLRYQDVIYLETERIPLAWCKREEKETPSLVLQELEIKEFSLLYINQQNPNNPTASFYLDYLKNGLSEVTPKLEMILGHQVKTIILPAIPADLNSRIFTEIPIPKGRFLARVTITSGDVTRSQEIEVNNIVDKPEVVLTNWVDSLIQYNNVLFSWKGYYNGQFNEQIEYQYNLDYNGWTSPNSEWRSVRYYNLAEGYHNFQVRAIYQNEPSEIRQVTFFIDTQQPIFNSDKITINRKYDSQGVLYAVKISGLSGAISDSSLDQVFANETKVQFQKDGSFTTELLPIKTDGSEEIILTAYDRVGNYTDYMVVVENQLTEVVFPHSGGKVRYSPLTLVGKIAPQITAKMDIYVADFQSTVKNDYSGWKKATINADRTFFVEDLLINPGTASREIVTTLNMACVFESGKTFERKIDVIANELIMPIEMELSAQAVEGENTDVAVTISCQANVPNISSWSIDFDGDGVYDLVDLMQNPASEAAKQHCWKHQYSVLGLVKPRVRVITTDGDFFSASKTLIIHEKIREASFKMMKNPISMSTLRMPDESNRIFVLRKQEEEFLVEVYEVRRNNTYLSNKLYEIDLSAHQINNPVKIEALAEDSLLVVSNNDFRGMIYQLKADRFGNYRVVAMVYLEDEVADFTIQEEALLVSMNNQNTMAWVPLVEGLLSQEGVVSKKVELTNTLLLGEKVGLETDGHHFFIADTLNQRIIQLSPSLRLLDQFGVRGNGEGEFIRPEIIRYYENRIFVSDSGRRDLQVFDREYNPICTLAYQDKPDYHNYVEADFFDDIADFQVIAREEGERLYYYALILSRTAGKLSMIRLPQWEELKVRVRNNQIVFIREGEVYTAKPDGSDLKKTISSDSLPRIQGTLDYPALAPDGRRLVFTSRAQLYNGEAGYDEDNIYTYSNLYCLTLDNKNLTRIDLGTLSGYEIERPVFNSNGSKVVFSAKPHRGKWQIYIYDFQSGQTEKLFATDENARYPYFSPDDRFIVFTSDFVGNEEIEIINVANPSVRVRVTSNHCRDSFPVWGTVYPGEITNYDLQKIIKSKIAFVSERDNRKGVYYVYLAQETNDMVSVYDLKNNRVVGNQPDTAAIEITYLDPTTRDYLEGDYPCFTGDGRSLIFEHYDGYENTLKRLDFETNLENLLKGESKTYESLVQIYGANRPSGMKNMITNFVAENCNGNEMKLSWDRYTNNDIFYIVEYKPVNSEDVYRNYVLSQTGTLLTGLKMGMEYLVRVFVLENEVEVTTSYWAKVKMPEVMARPSYTIDPNNPYLVHLRAWKPEPAQEYKWRFSWIIENTEIQVQNSQDYLYEFGTSGTKTIFLKAYTEGQTATHVSQPLEVNIISDLKPVIEHTLADDASYIELSAESSLGKKLNLSSAQWIISGPGREPLIATGSKVTIPLDGFQRKINVSLTLQRIAVNNQSDVAQVNRTIDLDLKEIKPIITYEPAEANQRLIRFSGEYSLGNINWSSVRWALFANGGLLYTVDGVTTFDYLFPETNQDTVYTICLTAQRRNDGKTVTASQVVTVAAEPIEPKINYEIIELKQGEQVVGAKILFDCTESKGSGIDYTLARWAVPVASTYNEQVVQMGPIAVYNLFGVTDDLVIEVALTLSRKNGIDPITVTRYINISKSQLPLGKLIVDKKIEDSVTGKVLVMDVFKSTGPNIDWERTEWHLEGEPYVHRGPVLRKNIPMASTEGMTISYTCLLYRYGAATPEKLEDKVEISKTTITPIISAKRLSGSKHRMYELSVLETAGINIDWERTRWYIYDGGEKATELRGSVVAHSFAYRDEQMGYPVLVEMFLKGSSYPFVAYTTVDVEGDLLLPIITTEADPERPNLITFSAISSRGSNINWAQTRWSFGDSKEVQYGPVVTYEYPVTQTSATYKVTLTLNRTTADGIQEVKTTSKEIRIGADVIRAVIKAVKYGDYLVLSAEESEGKGLLLDRCTWLFEGQGDTESFNENIQGGVIRRETYSESSTFSSHTKANLSMGLSYSIGGWFTPKFNVNVSTGIGSSNEYTSSSSPVIWEKADYSDYKNENHSFSTQNSHIGAVARRYVGEEKNLVVTLFVYRVTEDGVEGESVTVQINLNDTKLTRGVNYGK